jgi:CHAD domain-containing protein
MSLRLLRNPSIGPAFVELAARQLDKALARADDFGADPSDRIHDVRKRSKRLRAMLRLVESDFPDYRRLDKAIAAAARKLARMRDARVLRQTLDALYEWAGRPERLPPLPTGSGDQAERAGLAAFAAAIRKVAGGIPRWRIRRLDHDTVARGLAATFRKARRARRKAEHTGDALDFHRWRKQAKYHWHQLGLVKDTAPEILRPEARSARELTRILGEHHDLAMLRDTLRDNPDAFGTAVDVGAVEDAAAARQRELAALAGRIADQLFAEKPRAFARRLAAYWSGVDQPDESDKAV